MAALRIIPAYAGSTSSAAAPTRGSKDHPRIRGEHDTLAEVLRVEGGSSPHTRGALLKERVDDVPVRIIPAYAGSTEEVRQCILDLEDHPRIRGEHAHLPSSFSILKESGSSPHTRGALLDRDVGGEQCRIIPAYAGSTATRVLGEDLRGDHPRIRGEHSLLPGFFAEGFGSSPHTRGAPRRQPQRPRPRGIIPAYAGSTVFVSFSEVFSWDHPRIRGEHDFDLEAIVDELGSSPHTRGAPRDRARTTDRPRIIPAYAGSTGSPESMLAGLSDHPRIRGEHPSSARVTCPDSGSSPHTRGARLHGEDEGVPRGIIPAYAGSTGFRHAQGADRRDHPRIRGEHQKTSYRVWLSCGSSPHTRGAPGLLALWRGKVRIIPAYAGSTSDRPLERNRLQDHPRIRGEHNISLDGSEGETGSSPHTRGARRIMPASRAPRGIIPAYAGSTSPRLWSLLSGTDHPRIRGEHPSLWTL